MTASLLSLRSSGRVDMVGPIRDYIAENHIQNPVIFTDDLSTLNQLRNNAVSITSPSQEAMSTLLAYAGQLSWLVGKFPVDVWTT